LRSDLALEDNYLSLCDSVLLRTWLIRILN